MSNKLLNHHLFRYIVIGGLSYAVELLSIYVLTAVTRSSLIAVAIAFWIGLFVSFVLQKTVAFRNKLSSRKELTKQTAYYIALVLANYGFTILFVAFIQPYTGLVLARTLALFITTAWNYYIYKRIIFKV